MIAPEPPASTGPAADHPPGRRPGVAHLVCHCQLPRARRLTLCGVDVDEAAPTLAVGDQACVVCAQLGVVVFVARRCERCPR